MRLGDVLVGFRHDAHMTVRELAKEIGCSPATMNRLERGYSCDSDTLAKVMLWLLGRGSSQGGGNG